MRFYEFQYKQLVVDKITNVSVEIPKREWFGSERDAVVRRLWLFRNGYLPGKKADHEIWPVDIPTSKADLLAWLRRECQ